MHIGVSFNLEKLTISLFSRAADVTLSAILFWGGSKMGAIICFFIAIWVYSKLE
jgi:hypothetical protein